MLVEAQPDLNDLFGAVSFASGLSGVSVVSMSWGSGEFSTESSYDSIFTTPAGHNGVTFVAASGDDSTVEYPAASPNVLAVGGTTLVATSSGSYVSETGWSDSGGGTSAYEPKPSWQTNGLSSTKRTTPDVAWDAAITPPTGNSPGVSVYDSVPYGGESGWWAVGGTSVGTPSWSGLIAIADQGLAINKVGSLSNAQASLYSLDQSAPSDFNDITTGSSGPNKATKGYDLVTGLGSPKANLLVPALVQLNTPALAKSLALSAHVATVSHQSVSMSLVIVQDPTTTQATSTSTTTSSTSTSSTSITPLNPNATSATSTSSVTPVLIVPPPLAPIAIHLGASVSPVTLQAINSPLALVEEQPSSLTQFGQALQTELQKPLKLRLSPQPDAVPWIDVVDPFQPLDPAEAPKNQAAPAPGASRAWTSPLLLEPAQNWPIAAVCVRRSTRCPYRQTPPA